MWWYSIRWEGGGLGLLFPCLLGCGDKAEMGMKDRLDDTLKLQERVLAFVSAPRLRCAPGASGDRDLPHLHGSESSEPSVGSPASHSTALCCQFSHKLVCAFSPASHP